MSISFCPTLHFNYCYTKILRSVIIFYSSSSPWYRKISLHDKDNNNYDDDDDDNNDNKHSYFCFQYFLIISIFLLLLYHNYHYNYNIVIIIDTLDTINCTYI